MLRNAVDIPAWLERDRATDFGARVRRDRAIGLQLQTGSELDRVLEWWRRVDGSTSAESERLERLRSLTLWLTAAAAATFGVLAALAVLRYDGAHPVNVLTAFALLVVLPVFLWAVSLALMLPTSTPGLGALRDAIAALNLGNAMLAVLERLSRRGTGISLRLSWRYASRGPLARLTRWQLVALSQAGGFAFSLAALCTCLALVAVTDLAFGWSTTLEIDSERLTAWVQSAAAPWSFLGVAVPDADLVANSRYFRLERADDAAMAPETLTGWWSFLVVSMFCYVLVPRSITWFVAASRLRAATNALLLEDAGVRALLDRMSSAALGAAAQQPAADSVADVVPHTVVEDVTVAEPAVAVAWNFGHETELAQAWLAAHVAVPEAELLLAGGGQSLEQDRAVLAAAGATGVPLLLMLVKSWEPPLLDCVDFLAEARRLLGERVSIMVVPLGLAGKHPDPNDVGAWRHTVAKLGDPRVYLDGASRGSR